MTRKIICGLLAALMTAAFLAGCAGAHTPSQTTPTPQPETGATPDPEPASTASPVGLSEPYSLAD